MCRWACVFFYPSVSLCLPAAKPLVLIPFWPAGRGGAQRVRGLSINAAPAAGPEDHDGVLAQGYRLSGQGLQLAASCSSTTGRLVGIPGLWGLIAGWFSCRAWPAVTVGGHPPPWPRLQSLLAGWVQRRAQAVVVAALADTHLARLAALFLGPCRDLCRQSWRLQCVALLIPGPVSAAAASSAQFFECVADQFEVICRSLPPCCHSSPSQ